VSPRVGPCTDRERHAQVVLGEHREGIHRYCAPEMCEWAANNRDAVVNAGLGALGAHGLAIVVLGDPLRAVPHQGRSYRTAGPHRTALGKRPEDGDDYYRVSKTRALIVCKEGHLH